MWLCAPAYQRACTGIRAKLAFSLEARRVGPLLAYKVCTCLHASFASDKLGATERVRPTACLNSEPRKE